VNYVFAKFEGREIAKVKIGKLKVIAETSDLTDKIIDKGLLSDFTDFEDSLQYYCAVEMNCDIIITRNGKDFKESGIPVLMPSEYLKSLKTKRQG
jgi:hypothetical protein